MRKVDVHEAIRQGAVFVLPKGTRWAPEGVPPYVTSYELEEDLVVMKGEGHVPPPGWILCIDGQGMKLSVYSGVQVEVLKTAFELAWEFLKSQPYHRCET